MHSKLLSGLALFASISPLASAMAIKGAMIDRRRQPSSSIPSPLEQRDLSFCQPIQKFVDLLKVQQATAFCSSYLNIQTVSIPTIQVVQTYTTTTSTVEETVTATVTAATDSLTFVETEIIATLPTVVATNTVVTSSTTTIFSTPPAQTVITTTYTTPLPAKRGVEVARRDIKLPSYVAGFAPPAISKACSCLEIPTPTVTFTATSVNPNTIQTQVTETEINTKYVTLTVSTTNSAKITTYTPVTSTTTSTTVIQSTSILPTPTITSTSTIAFRPQCTGLLAKSKLVQYATYPGRRAAYRPIDDIRIPGDGSQEYTHSICCEFCYNLPDCLYSAALSENGGPWFCRKFYTYDTVAAPVNVSPQCPKGRPSGDTIGPRVGAYEHYKSYIVGPCLGYDLPV